ncbi:TPA: protein-L-isoaspartate(D-aspartate) O-methyltransferase [Candidatus Acetothermia bacterium]|nr:protein-L-isoaspartate(D-aspartate) O-methyltransferase [Candidatus Acetothermia bacterium]
MKRVHNEQRDHARQQAPPVPPELTKDSTHEDRGLYSNGVLAKGGSVREIPELIEAYVADLKKRALIKSAAVEHAFRRVSRHRLLEGFYREDEQGEHQYGTTRFAWRKSNPDSPDPDLLRIVYSDTPVLTRLSPPSSTSQPYLVARMLELLELEQGMNVLEIGAGTGYNAALIQEIVGKTGHVTTLDIQADVVEQTTRLLKAAGYRRIEVIAKDGAMGHAENAPYDRIVATVGCSDVSSRWVEQLAERGFMLIPLQHGAEGFDPLTRIWVEEERVLGRFVGWSGFMSIRGALESEQRLSFEKQEQVSAGPPQAELPVVSVSEEIERIFGRTWNERTEDEQARYLDFPLFLAVSGWDVFWTKEGSGLWHRRGGVVVGKHKVLVHGDVSLVQDLQSLCAEWVELGRPGHADWRLEFQRRADAAELPGGEGTWTIERKFSTEVARLEKP